MTIPLKEVEERALLLPPKEREILADRLLSSLDSEPLTHINEAWIQEAERRYKEYKDGNIKGIPGDRVFNEIRQELGWQN